MIRANVEQQKHTPWFAKAGAACSIVPISRFVGPNIFAQKGGGYGCLFSLTGLDEEGLTDLELEARVRQIEGALRGLPEGSCLYQYTRVMSGFELPRQDQYANEVTEAFASDRLAHLDKTAAFRRIDLHWCLTLELSQVKAFARKPADNAVDTSRMLSDLEKTATLLEGHLGSSLGLRMLSKAEAFQFFSYLFNLEEWAGRDQLRTDTGVDRQIVKSPVAWHSDHVQIGKRHVQMFSLKTTPEASRPCLFSGLLTLDCDSVLCTTWRVKSASAARSEIDQQEKFISFFKVGVLIHIVSDHGNEYTLQLQEISSDADAHFDSKVFILPGDKAAKDRLTELPVFVPAAELDKAKQEAVTARAAQAAELKPEEAKAETYRSQYPGSLHFDFLWDEKKGKQLGLQQIWHDDKFTYLRGQFQETPALYELKDGKGSLINFDYNAGLYTVPKELDNGYLAIGKKKVEFHRVEEGK